MNLIFTTGEHPFLMPSEQIEELKDTAFNTFCFRLPDYSEEHIELEAWKCKWACDMLHSKLLIYHDVALVKLVSADGIIVTNDDLPARDIRTELDSEKMIVGCASNFEDAINFAIEGVDILLIGPVFSRNNEPEIGFEGLKMIVRKLNENNLDIPVWAFGGITPENQHRAKNIPVAGISVSSFILDADEINQKAKRFS